ncbi:hypothetical protein [Oceanobacillus sp. J11TS1]|nr:hypothetical protein [Oceanobacillus sp. J11TS1]
MDIQLQLFITVAEKQLASPWSTGGALRSRLNALEKRVERSDPG